LTALPHPDTGRTEGLRRKEGALSLLAATRKALIRRGCRALLSHLLDHGTATADAVRHLVTLPAGIGPKVFGAVPGPLLDSGLIRAAGYTPSERPEAHARPVTVWALADRATALAWLAAHPAETEPEPSTLFDNLQ
jgi:hypothetical protein